MAVLLAVPMVQGVEIGPGNQHACNGTFDLVFCTACTGNETCPECTNCGTCSIDEKINPGETYEKDSGACDLDIYCRSCEETELEPRDYHMEISINKPHENDSLNFGIEIRDFTSALVDTKMYEFDPEDIASIRYKYDFECPTKVIFDSVNTDTCAEFFEEFYMDKDPLSMMLAADMTDYRNRYTGCLDNKSQIEWQIAHYESLYLTCENIKQNALKDMNRMNDTVITMRKDITGSVTAESQGELISMTLMASIGWGCLIVLAVVHMYGGKG